MARIKNIELPKEKSIQTGLTAIYGIGRSLAKTICENANVDFEKKVKDLTDAELAKIRAELAHYKTEGELKREILLNIKRLQEIGCYRGIRHRRGLPVRGQRTKTNARTRKGPRKTIANKKEAVK